MARSSVRLWVSLLPWALLGLLGFGWVRVFSHILNGTLVAPVTTRAERLGVQIAQLDDELDERIDEQSRLRSGERAGLPPVLEARATHGNRLGDLDRLPRKRRSRPTTSKPVSWQSVESSREGKWVELVAEGDDQDDADLASEARSSRDWLLHSVMEQRTQSTDPPRMAGKSTAQGLAAPPVIDPAPFPPSFSFGALAPEQSDSTAPEPSPRPHDLAITRVAAPSRVTLTESRSARTRRVVIEVENRSPHDEMVRDRSALDQLIQLDIESLGGCAQPGARLDTWKPVRAVPFALAPGERIEASFEVRFECANDPARTSSTDRDHDDYRYRVMLNHPAFDGQTDGNAVDDVCPRPRATVLGKTDPGCGRPGSGREPASEIVTDVVWR